MTAARFATMTTSQLLQHDRNIGDHLSRPGITKDPVKAREWLDARKAVRNDPRSPPRRLDQLTTQPQPRRGDSHPRVTQGTER